MKSISTLTSETATVWSHFRIDGLINMLPNPDTILRKSGKTIEAYRELKYDPHVWACIQSRKSGITSLEYTLQADGADDTVFREIERIFRDLDILRFERDVLEAPLFGYQPMEIVWKASGQNRKMIVPDRIIAKPQEWFVFDDSGNLKFKRPGYAECEALPENKFLCVRYEPDYLNPYGQALLAKCYWHVTFKKGGLKFWVNFAERYGMPLLVGQYNRGSSTDEALKLAEELDKMSGSSVIVTPSDIDIQMKEASRSSSIELYSELIKYCNSEISKAILSQTLTTEVGTGSYAAALTHFKVRREVILGDLRLVEDAANNLIKYIVDLNFARKSYPRFKLVLNDGDNDAMAERDLKIAASGNIKFTKNYWINRYGFKENEIE